MKDDALGAAGELAFCLMMGLPWPESVDTFRDEPDIPPDNEVRTTRGYRNIIIHTEDREGPRSELRYNAVVYGAGVFTLWGWIMGHEAQGWPLEDRGGFGRPACFIPVESLHRYPVIARHRPPKPPQIAIGL